MENERNNRPFWKGSCCRQMIMNYSNLAEAP